MISGLKGLKESTFRSGSRGLCPGLSAKGSWNNLRGEMKVISEICDTLNQEKDCEEHAKTTTTEPKTTSYGG